MAELLLERRWRSALELFHEMQVDQVVGCVVKFLWSSSLKPIPSMGLVYENLHEWLILMVN